MSQPSVLQGDLIVFGNLSSSGLDVPAGAIGNAEISTSVAERIAAAKLVHQFPASARQVHGTDVVARTEIIHIAKGAGTVAEFSAAVTAIAAEGDKSLTVDLQKSTGGGAFATLLAAPIAIDASEAALTKYTATLVVSPTYVAGDLLAVVVTVAGSEETQSQGLAAVAMLQENPA